MPAIATLVLALALALVHPLGCVGKVEHWSDAVVRAANTAPPWQGYNYARHENFTQVIQKMRVQNYVTPRDVLLNGVSYVGVAARLRIFLKKLIRGDAVTIGAIGGSITSRTTGGRSDSYVDMMAAWVQEMFPNPNHKTRNGGVPGTTSSYLSVCQEAHLANDLDLVVVELAVNDPHEADPNFETSKRRAIERLIRKLLQMPKQPAVIMVNMFAYCKIIPCGRFFSNAERDFSELALYYSLPSVSLKAGIFHEQDVLAARNASEEHFSLPMFYDHSKIHPGKFGHYIATEMVVTLFNKVLRDMVSGDFSEDQEEALAHEVLPRPMIENNWEPKHSTCIIGEVFRQHTLELMGGVEPAGWNWTDEKGKVGFISYTPGSTLNVQVDSTVATSKDGSEAVMVQLSFLQSYEHMGKAEIQCISGCTCTKGVYDGHTPKRASVTHMYDVMVTQTKECVMTVTVLAETNSGETKVKLLGVVVSEETGETRGPVLNGFARVDKTAFSIPPRPPPRPPKPPTRPSAPR